MLTERTLATSSEEACKFHEDNEGYDPGYAKAEKVLSIPKDTSTETGWPSEELLISLGAKFIYNDDLRIVEIEGRKFSEGMLESLIREVSDDEFEARGDGRPNETKKSSEH